MPLIPRSLVVVSSIMFGSSGWICTGDVEVLMVKLDKMANQSSLLKTPHKIKILKQIF